MIFKVLGMSDLLRLAILPLKIIKNILKIHVDNAILKKKLIKSDF